MLSSRLFHGIERMSTYRLLLHESFDESLQNLPLTTQRKAVWAQVLLGTRGRTPIVKGTAGRNARWRRTPVQGNHYYMWWIPQSESPLADATIDISGDLTDGNGGNGADAVNTILVHSVRHHDRTDEPIRTGSLTEYRAVPVASLDPRFDEQKAVSAYLTADDLSVVTIKGLPGSGKTVALLYLLRDLINMPGDGRILYVTYTRRLKRAAREFVEPVSRRLRAENLGDGRQQFGNGRLVIRSRMRKNDRVHLGMRHVERAAKHMTKLMMQRHADLAENRSAEPGAVLRHRPRMEIGPVGVDAGHCGRECANALHRHQASDRVAIPRIKAFDRMSDRVHGARSDEMRR